MHLLLKHCRAFSSDEVVTDEQLFRQTTMFSATMKVEIAAYVIGLCDYFRAIKVIALV